MTNNTLFVYGSECTRGVLIIIIIIVKVRALVLVRALLLV